MDQEQIEYWEMVIEKVNELEILNEKVYQLMGRYSQILVNVRNPSYLKPKTFEYCLLGVNRLYIQFFVWTWWCVAIWVKYMTKYFDIFDKLHDKLMC